jgi:hypothetical protein
LVSYDWEEATGIKLFMTEGKKENPRKRNSSPCISIIDLTNRIFPTYHHRGHPHGDIKSPLL